MAGVSRLTRLGAALPEPVRQRVQRLQHRESLSLDRPVTRSTPRGVAPEIVSAFDAHAVRAGTAAALVEALAAAGIDFVVVPGPHRSVRQIGVAAEDRARVLAALDRAVAAPGWALTPSTDTARRRAAVLTAYRVLAAPGGQVLSGAETGCALGFWKAVAGGSAGPVARREGGAHRPGTRLAPSANGVASYLSPEAWTRATAARSHWVSADPLPDVFEVRSPVDVVYTWVDGDDPVWQASRAAYAPDDGHNDSAAHASRYRSRDELRYSLRSVAMYAGWVRRIYLVTDGQVPPWLDTSHPKIELVTHRDLFADHSALPVFNSHAIESRLHHLEGLSEHYLYLNDDMFLGRPVEPELFFAGDAIEKVFLSKDTMDLDPPTARDLPAAAAGKNQRELLEREFGVTVHRKYQHAVHPQLRSVVCEMEQRHPELFQAVARSRFRHPDDHSIPSALQHSYALALGRAVPGQWQYQYQDIGRNTTPRALDGLLRRRPHSFCLNDMGTEEIAPERQDELLARFFAEYFPVAAPWELAAGASAR